MEKIVNQRNTWRIAGTIIFMIIIGLTMIACSDSGSSSKPIKPVDPNDVFTISGSFKDNSPDGVVNARFVAKDATADPMQSASLGRSVSSTKSISAFSDDDIEIPLEGLLEDGDITFRLKGSYNTETTFYSLSAAGSFLRYSISGLSNSGEPGTAIVQINAGSQWISIQLDATVTTTGTPDAIGGAGDIEDELSSGIPETMWGVWYGSEPYAITSNYIVPAGEYYFVIDSYTMTFYVLKKAEGRSMWNCEGYYCFYDGINSETDFISGLNRFDLDDREAMGRELPESWTNLLLYGYAQEKGKDFARLPFKVNHSIITDPNRIGGQVVSDYYAAMDTYYKGYIDYFAEKQKFLQTEGIKMLDTSGFGSYIYFRPAIWDQAVKDRVDTEFETFLEDKDRLGLGSLSYIDMMFQFRNVFKKDYCDTNGIFLTYGLYIKEGSDLVEADIKEFNESFYDAFIQYTKDKNITINEEAAMFDYLDFIKGIYWSTASTLDGLANLDGYNLEAWGALFGDYNQKNLYKKVTLRILSDGKLQMGAYYDGNSYYDFDKEKVDSFTVLKWDNIRYGRSYIPMGSTRFAYYWINSQDVLGTTADSVTAIDKGSSLIITAAESGYTVKGWYLNGAVVNGQTGSTYTFSSSKPGKYNVGLLVEKGSKYYSANFIITVR
jgi:hypothetical protein